MATNEWDELPPDWSEREADVFWGMADQLDPDDNMLQVLYHNAYFVEGQPADGGFWGDERAAVREALAEYIYEQYGFLFEEIHDWEAWREAYGVSD